MPLTFNIRHIENKDLQFDGELPLEELELELHDDMAQPTGPLSYNLVAESLEGAVLVRGELSLPMEFTCVRCLKKFCRPLAFEDWICHVPLTGEDAVPVSNDLVNLTPLVREDILLALPQHPLCEPECGGLKLPVRAKDPGKAPEKVPSAWDELDKLKLKN
jgi:uncharacterized metal-binding protein YceD (DUF177 family)